MAVRADDRQVTNAGIKLSGDGACGGVGGEKPIVVEHSHRLTSDARSASLACAASGCAAVKLTVRVEFNVVSRASGVLFGSSSMAKKNKEYRIRAGGS